MQLIFISTFISADQVVSLNFRRENIQNTNIILTKLMILKTHNQKLKFNEYSAAQLIYSET